MSNRFGIVTALIALTVCVSASAQERRFPDSPTGRALDALITALEDGTEETLGVFVDSHLDSLFVENMSRSGIIDALGRVHQDLHPFDIESVVKTGPWSAECIVAAVESPMRLKLSFDLSARPPHRFNGLGIEPADAVELPIDSIDQLDELLTSRAADGSFSGAVLIERNGETVFHRAYGMASKRYAVANQLDTRFNIGSLNKLFTSVAVLQLAEDGRLDLDDTIGEYLDGFPPEVSDAVTVRHLLQHRSGWGSYWENEYYRRHWTRLRTVSDYVHFIREIPLDFEPGSSEQYSNAGYEVLGAIVEAVSGLDYYDYVKQNIYSPAGMGSTDSYESDQVVPNLATGYLGGPDGAFETENTFMHSIRGTPAGGGYSTAADLQAFFRALESGSLVGKKYVHLMFNRYDPPAGNRDLNGAIGLGGGGPGINAAVERDFSDDVLVIVLSNYDPPTAEELAAQLARLLRAP